MSRRRRPSPRADYFDSHLDSECGCTCQDCQDVDRFLHPSLYIWDALSKHYVWNTKEEPFELSNFWDTIADMEAYGWKTH